MLITLPSQRFLPFFLFLLFAAGITNAEKLYWVGGSGNFNDPAHWSRTSGGKGGIKAPTVADDVYFDSKSFRAKSVINFVGGVNVHDFIFLERTSTVVFQGTSNEKWTVEGSVQLNPDVENQFLGQIRLTSQYGQTNTVGFSHFKIQGILTFEGNGTWDVRTLVALPASSIFLNKGRINVLRGGGIFAGDIIANKDEVELVIEGAILSAENKLRLGSKVKLYTNESIIQATQSELNQFIQANGNKSAQTGLELTPIIPLGPCAINQASKTQPTCAGVSNGTVTYTMPVSCAASGPPYKATWSLPVGSTCALPTPNPVTAIPAGAYVQSGFAGCGDTYTIVFRDASNSIAQIKTVDFTSPGEIVPIFTTVSPDCFANCNGSIDLLLSGGVPNYNITWNPGAIAHNNNIGIDGLTSLCVTGSSDTYTVTITDVNNCTRVDSVTITQPDLLQTNGTSTNVTCFGLSDGSAIVTPSGGTTAYTYEWDANPLLNAASIAGLSGPTSHTCVVTDANACTDTFKVNIIQPADLTYTTGSSSPLNCADVCDGVISATAIAGGTLPYSYLWSPAIPSVVNTGSSTTATGACPTDYTLTVTDANTCTYNITYSLTSPTLLVADATITNATCNATSTGALAGNASGGTVGYTYNWYQTAGPPAAPSFIGTPYSNLTAGTYTLVVVDNLGCNDTATLVVTEPSTISITLTPTNPTCFGLLDGQITSVVGGGTPPYTYSWSTLPVQTTADAVGIGAGTYTLTVTDFNGCTQTANITLTDPTDITANVVVTNPTCNGVCDGIAAATPSGGGFGAPYSYLWLCDGSTNDSITGQCHGACMVTITDVGGCNKTVTATFVEPAAITYLQAQVDLTCTDVCNGSATVNTIAGGTAPYSYSWTGSSLVGATTNAAAASTASSLCEGTYTLTITDANACSVAPNFTLTSPGLLLADATISNVACNASSTGSLTGNASGGTPAYTYNWYKTAAPPAAPTFTGTPYSLLPAGTYTLVVVDNLGCNDTATFVITEPTPLTLSLTPTNPACFGTSTGSIVSTAGGGTLPYTYTWTTTPVQSTANATAIPAGSYTLSILDNNNCFITANATLTDPPDITPNLVVVNPTCNGACDGTAAVAPTGGGGGISYTYVWTCDPGVLNNVAGQCAGTCDVTITDNIGCNITTTATFVAPAAVSVALSATPVLCSGNTSTITSVITGGTPAYTYLWSPGGQTTSGIAGVTAGTYTLDVTDANNCNGTDNVTITIPTSLNVTLTPTDPLCNGSSDGSISSLVSGGTGAYTYSWSPVVAATANINLVPAGTYTLNVNDANGCLGTQQATLTAPLPITIATSTTPVSCNGGLDGTVTANPSGGTPGYTYSWASPLYTGSTNATYTALPAAIYTITITDTHLCTATANVTVTQPAVLAITVNSIVAACNVCNGTATLGHTGGTGAVTFSVDAGASSGTTALTGLCAGMHTVDAIDANGCTATTTFIVPQVITLTVTTSKTLLTCNADCNGSATANVSGNIGAISYNWLPTVQTTQTATALCAGTHTVTVTDAATGCFAIDSATFVNPPVLTVTTSKVDAQCFGNCDGSVTAIPLGGVPPYTYSWSNGASTATSSLLCPGTYTITLTDANGCIFTPHPTATVANGNSFAGTVVTPTPPTACTSSDGSITITVSGGTPPYTHLWNTGATTATLSGVPDGAYTDVITDAHGCDTTIVVGLSDPNGPTTTHTNTNNLCNLACLATATVDVLAGNAPYVVTWPGGLLVPGAPPYTANNLCAGVFAVMVTDVNDCNSFETVTITEPAIVAANQVITDVSCNGVTDGIITLAPTGGTAPYTYTIDGVADDNNMTGLAAGVHNVVITDANSCTYNFAFTITEPSGITVTTVATNITCAGPNTGTASASAVGGTLPYSYAWAPGGAVTSSIVNKPLGTYTVTVTDGHGCTGTAQATIGQNPALVSGFTQTNNICNSGCTGSALFSPSGGDGAYTYFWNTTGNPTTISVANICPGTYRAIVYDGNACSDTTDFTITAPPVVAATFASVSPSCHGLCDGSTVATGTGGTAGAYTYSWAPIASNVASATNLCAGTNYTVTVTDINNCVGTSNVTLTEPAVLSAGVTVTQPSCNGVCDATLSSVPTGGTAPYTYDWFPATTSSLTSQCAGTYTLVVRDANNCKDSVNPVVTDPAALSLNASTSPSTCHACNGAITVTLAGGQSISWLSNPPGGTNPVQTNVCPGIYSVELSQGVCKDTFNVTINTTSGPTVTVSTTSASCHGVCDGSASIGTITGTFPFTYSWSAPLSGSLATVSNVCAGSYVLSVTDAIGCATFTPFTISEPAIINDNAAIIDATCNGLTDGSITLTPTGDTPPYTYLWSTGSTSKDLLNVGPGNYSVTIKGATNCSQTFNYTINSNTQINYSLAVVNNSCSGQCIGSATLSNITGGTAPYHYLWSDPAATTGLVAGSLCSGTYTVTVTDNIGCQLQVDTSIITPNPILDNQTKTSPGCGVCDGLVTVAPSGGTSPYTYSWSTGATSASITNVCAGSYTVDITDANNCNASFSYNINSLSAPTVTNTVTNVLCHGDLTGDISSSPAGGTAPYFYSWSPGGQSTQNIVGQGAGTYTLTVTDAHNCSAVVQSTITEPADVDPNPIITSPSCGHTDGTIVLSTIGGTAPYTYLWPTLGNQTTATITNVGAGNPTVQITDNVGCIATYTITVSNASGPVIGSTVTDETCSGSCNGAITTTVTGGTLPYSYLWTPGGQTTSGIAAQCSGNYNVQVTDATGCVSTDNITINSGSLITAIPTATDPTCGQANGQISMNPSGGTAPYTFAWSNGATTQTITGLAAAVYTVTINDAGSCVGTFTVTLSNAGAPNVGLNITDISCNGLCDGSINSTIAGGTAPYTYSWSNFTSAANITTLCAGTYTLTVTDNIGCVATATGTVNEPAIITDNTAVTHPSCGACNGQATLNPSGGTAPYTYNWASGMGTNNTVNSLCAGTYSVTVTDAHSCISTFTVGISNSSGPTVTASSTNIDCYAACNGTLSATVTGGTAPYNYSWTTLPAQTSANVNGQCAGTYFVTVTDAANCTTVSSTTISENTPITLGGTVVQPTCGQNNGQINALAAGGVAPYTYLWSGGLGTNPSISNLAAGVYDITITDSKGCDTTISVTLSNTGAPAVALTVTDVNCFGSCNGSVTSVVTGGTAPYTYTWSDFSSGTSIASLCAGSYTLSVQDQIGCISTSIATVSEPTQLLDNATTTSPSCGVCNGIATVTPSGGTAPYTYSWAGGLGSTSSIANLCAGSYTVAITDGHACASSFTVAVSNSTGPHVSFTVTNINCFSGCNGSITSTLSGGTPPYTYSWSTVPVQTTQNLSGLCAGNYFLTITDAANCQTIADTTVRENTQITLGGTVSQPKCNQNNGQIIVEAAGGVAPYTYFWSGGLGTNDTLNNLAAGVYNVTVTDFKGCDTTISITLSNAGAPSVTLTAKDVNCFSDCNGTITSAVTGGTAPYSYTWSNFSTNANLTSLCAGSYTLNVTDNLGCVANDIAVVNEPLPLAENATITTPGCGACNGTATVTPSGGVAPYTIAWVGASTTGNTISNLCAGTYSLDITDAHSCTSHFTVGVGNSTGPNVLLTPIHSGCYGKKMGSVISNVSGGLPPYTYVWSASPAVTSPNIIGYLAGTYFVSVTDANNCKTIAFATIIEKPAFNLGGTVKQPTCGVNNGEINLVVTGATPPYTFSWSGGLGNNDTLKNLGAGNYAVTIKDAVGCDSTFNIILSNAGAPTLTLASTDVSCPGSCNGSVTSNASGGTPPYTYSWSSGAGTTSSIANMCAGTYTLTLTDNIGCLALQQATIGSPDTLNPRISLIYPGCGLSNGQIATSVIGGTPPYTYTWFNSASTNDTLKALSAGFYQLTVTDAHNCSKVFDISLDNPAGPNVTFNQTNINCFNDCNGSITPVVTGGTAPFTYSWTTGDISATISNLCAGTYSVTVVDSNNCTTLASTTITQNPIIAANEVITQPACGQSTGKIVLAVTGGLAPYTYSWNTGATTSTISSIPAGTYSVTVTDNVNCSSTFTITVSDINAPNIAMVAKPVKCYGSCNGSAVATVTGGTTPYTYSWSNGQTGTNITGQCVGTYVLSVADAAGCHSVKSAVIAGPDSLDINATITNPSCGLCNGAIVLHTQGGNGTYHYQWGGGQTSSTLTSQCAGVFVLQVADDSSCVSNYTITLNNPGAPTVATTVTNVNCNKACNGAISTTVTGHSPFSYVWSPMGQVSSSITGLCAGNYNVRVSDKNGCSATASATVTEPTPIASTQTYVNPTCGLCNGKITLHPTGGTGSTYTYSWGGGQTTSSVSNICAGVYNVNITDAVGCTATYSVSVSNAGAPTIVLNPVNVNCYGSSNGSITSLVTGGTQPYTYMWLPNLQTGTSINGLPAGTYFLQVLDKNGCISTDQATITQPLPFAFNPIIRPTTCDACNGIIVIQPAGGTGAYTYLWNNGSTNDTISGLCAGAYNVIVSNLSGCKDTIDIAMNNVSPSIQLALTSTNVKCAGSCDGTSTVVITGGTAPYKIPNWSLNGNSIAQGNPVSQLCAGEYAVTVNDSLGCSSVALFTIDEPTKLALSFSNVINPLCNGIPTGSIDLVPSGGVLPYTFVWTPPQTPSSQGADSLSAGVYSISVVDKNGCTIGTSTTLTEPSAINITAVITHTPCNTTALGAINVTVTGGVMPSPDYLYVWTGNTAAITQDLSGLVSGSYSLTVTDAHNCKADSLFHVSAIDTVIANAGKDTTFCFKGPVMLSGLASTSSNGTYNYVWTQLPLPGLNVGTTATITLTPPVDTTYFQLVVTNSNNCKDIDTVRVIAYPAPTALAGPDVEIFLDHSTLIGALPSVTGGTAPFNYHWTAIDTNALNGTYIPNPTASTSISMTYTLTIVDANGCKSIDSMRVTILPPIVVPSGFSPNGDNSNDFWWIDHIDRFPNSELSVFSRWGELLYYKKNYDNSWNGTHNGKALPVGTYYYILKLNDPEFNTPFTGPVTIFR